MKVELLAKGQWSVYAVCEGDAFLDIDIHDDEAERLNAMLDRIANDRHGPQTFDTVRNHQIDAAERLWQFRCGQIRVIWFYDEGRIVVCCHAYRKKSQQAPPREIKAARKVKAAYFAAKAQGTLEVIEDDNE